MIKAEGIGKSYLIGHKSNERYVALRDVIANKTKGLWSKIRSSQSHTHIDIEEFWALKDVSFEVKQGERIGIIGRNGAGKSTLLKILSRITEPTKGKVSIKGRVASLLEVGTGFHPELTGRENIFLNGAILGMTRAEIKRKFDEIVDFAEVEKFLDTPVKRFSSGMYVRLAFAVAAHLESEILVVDEVLAVGDAAFQKKCLGKIKDVSAREERTVLFVSHNMEAIKKICTKCILLKDGQIEMFDETNEVIKQYLQRDDQFSIVPLQNRRDREGMGGVKFTDIQITNLQNEKKIKSGDGLRIVLKYESEFKEKINDVRVVVVIANDDLRSVLWLDSDVSAHTFTDPMEPKGTIVCEAKEVDLIEGRYFATINFHIKGISRDLVMMASEFDIETDIDKYNYKIKADNTVCDYLVQYSFKQE